MAPRRRYSADASLCSWPGHRTFRSEEPDIRDGNPGRRLVGRHFDACDVLHRESEPHMLSKPRWLPIGSASLAEEPSAPLQAPEELEKVELRREWPGVLTQIRLRLPGIIGHGTSSCFWITRARVRTNALIDA